MMVTRWDKIVIVSILGIAVLFYAVFATYVFEGQAETVEICVNGKEYATYNLAGISKTKTVEIKTDFGYNVIELSSDGARITEASCPDKIDVQSGKITKPGQMVVCVPNRFSVRILGKSKNSVDKVTY